MGEALAVLDAAYDPAWAESWDAVGLVCGDPGAVVERVHLAVDPHPAVAAEAVAAGAQLLVTHHPLFLRGVHAVPASTPGGLVLERLIRGGCALIAVHTNADVAVGGVSDALADALDLSLTKPLQPNPAHAGTGRGLGRIGTLGAPVPLGRFAAQVRDALPTVAGGVRASAPAELIVRRVAVCGGAGLETAPAAAAAGADVLVTADARHHHTLDAPLPVLDVSHWASEWPWLGRAAALLETALPGLRATVSTLVTDPWRLHA